MLRFNKHALIAVGLGYCFEFKINAITREISLSFCETTRKIHLHYFFGEITNFFLKKVRGKNKSMIMFNN